MNYLKPVLTAAMLTLVLTGCDSKQENNREDILEMEADTVEQKADAVRDLGEETADRIEKQDPGMDSSATDHAAEATRESSETIAPEQQTKDTNPG